jgi:outer membrane lipoprotein SlyB
MNTMLVRFAVAIAIAALPMGAHALGTNEKGCLVGGAVGGVAGHTLGSGNHTLLGAAAGCAVGVVANKERVKRIDASKKQKQKVARKSYRQDGRDLQASR